jgi:hypothetical protein
MTLPAYSPDVFWKEYEIDKPAFRLSPLEKPDMSPYLVHMTGKNAIYKILTDGGKGQGKINAAKPSQTKSQWYGESVVCFTESPLFAIDAFRYISIDRWKQDLLYGLCFSKEKLVSQGVRPVFYADSELVADIKKLKDLMIEPSPDRHTEQTEKVLSAILPIMNSLMEYEKKQGFIWEREWRSVKPEGFVFSYEDIEIICCPDEEREEIAQILGEQAKRITFVSSWDQYDDVITFLKSRADGWKSQIVPNEADLEKLLRECKQERNKLIAYKTYAERLNSEMKLIEECTAALDTKIEQLSFRLEAVDDFCCVCGALFEDDIAPISWNEEDNSCICATCYSNFQSKCQESD